MAQKIANNYVTTLTSNILATDLLLPVASVAAVPGMAAGDYLYGAIVNASNQLEFFICTGVSGSNLVIPAGGRGVGGSTAFAYSNGDTVRCVLIRESLQQFQQEANVSVTGSGTDTYTGTYSPVLRGYVTGIVYHVTLANTNTVAAPTLNLNGLGATTIVLNGGAALLAGQIPKEAMFKYDGTNFVLLNAIPKSAPTSFVKRLTADHSVASTNATQTETDLQFPMAANEEWVVSIFVDFDTQSSSGCGLQVGVTIPAGAGGRAWGFVLGNSSAAACTFKSQASPANPVIIATGGGSAQSINPAFELRLNVVNGATPGNLTFTWAPGIVSAIITRLNKGGFLRADRVAP